MIAAKRSVIIGAIFAIVIVPCIRTLGLKAQTAAFGESFAVGMLAATGNCDAMWPGQTMSIGRNPAHAAWGSRWSAAGGYRRLYELEYLQRVWGAAKYKRAKWGIGLDFTRFGKEEFYTETEAAISLGVRPSKNFAVGLKLQSLRLAYTPVLPSYSGWSVGMGVIVRPMAAVLVSASVGHALNEKMIPGYDLPRRYHLAAAARLPGKVYLGAGWSKREGDRDILGLGQKIGVTKNFVFLSAVYFDPVRYAVGGTLDIRHQVICYTYLSHPELGGTHYLEFEFTWLSEQAVRGK